MGGKNYRTYSIPDQISIQLEKAIYRALRINDWNGDINPSTQSARVDAIELIAATFLLSNPDPYRVAIKGDPDGSLRINQVIALDRDKFRCIICNHSEVNAGGVEVHHIIPRSYHGPERPSDPHSADNLATLCHLHHEHITNAAYGGMWHWANIKDKLHEIITENAERALLRL